MRRKKDKKSNSTDVKDEMILTYEDERLQIWENSIETRKVYKNIGTITSLKPAAYRKYYQSGGYNI